MHSIKLSRLKPQIQRKIMCFVSIVRYPSIERKHGTENKNWDEYISLALKN